MRAKLTILAVIVAFVLTSCGKQAEPTALQETDSTQTGQAQQSAQLDQRQLKLSIGDMTVTTEWENNESVDALKDLIKEEPMVIPMSMYGGFEQVGDLGSELPSDDEQMKTKAGDIVLYAGNQIVLFYGSNTWEYTKLGRIVDLSQSEIEEILGKEDTTITLEIE